MPYAVELFFDLELDQSVRGLWDAFARETGRPNGMADTGNRPHISLAAFQDCELRTTISGLGGLCAGAGAVPVDLNSIGTFFSDEGVLFLPPVPTSQLIQLHLDCQSLLRPLVQGMWPYYLPGQLAFHCTLATGVPPAA
ncbi:MAG TPA: 2'-5' RNA ligase family protein, partial [bacterium]|nr:2'-5' RNA ligase family protein [bacterium]